MSIGNLVFLIYFGLFGFFGLWEFMHYRRLSVIESYKKNKKSLLWKMADCIFCCTVICAVFFFVVCFGCFSVYVSFHSGGDLHSPELVDFLGNALYASMYLFVVAIVAEFTFISALQFFCLKRQNQEALQ